MKPSKFSFPGLSTCSGCALMIAVSIGGTSILADTTSAHAGTSGHVSAQPYVFEVAARNTDQEVEQSDKNERKKKRKERKKRERRGSFF